jgi:hypothetical protein
LATSTTRDPAGPGRSSVCGWRGVGAAWHLSTGDAVPGASNDGGAPGAVASCRNAVDSCGAARRQGACALRATASSMAACLSWRSWRRLAAGVVWASERTAECD